MKIIKKTLRIIYLGYGLTLFTVSMLVVLLPIWIMSQFPEPQKARSIRPIFRIWMGFYLPMIFCPVIRRGKENFKKGNNYVVVINHNSLMDIPVSSPWIPTPTKTLGKIEMTKVPIFGIIYRAGAILVDRKNENSRRESLGKMQQILELGINLCIYPEGTRNKTQKSLQPFKDGAFVLAIKAQKEIIPGILFNTAKILPSTNPLHCAPKTIHFHFLEPIPTKGLTLNDVEHLKEKVHRTMESYYETNKNKYA